MMIYRDRKTGQLVEVGEHERVKRQVLDEAGWYLMPAVAPDAKVAPEVVQPVTPVVPQPPVIVPTVVAPPAVAPPEGMVTVLQPVVVSDEDEELLDDLLAGDPIENAPVEQPEPVVVARKGASGKKAGRPKKAAHAWISNLPENE